MVCMPTYIRHFAQFEVHEKHDLKMRQMHSLVAKNLLRKQLENYRSLERDNYSGTASTFMDNFFKGDNTNMMHFFE